MERRPARFRGALLSDQLVNEDAGAHMEAGYITLSSGAFFAEISIHYL